MANRLIHTSSPYLLQHAENPVDWYPWGEEALQKAAQEQKPIIVSIGYSACHWCHVMEHESFENEVVAQVMNRYFVCIKVDREERPDVDAIYMDAVQALGVSGGWPLNVFLLPNQEPFFGGTYFRPQEWVNLLEKIGQAFKHPEALEQLKASAQRLKEFLEISESERYGLAARQGTQFSDENLRLMFLNLAETFDEVDGGVGEAPKFPMPSIYSFLLRYAYLENDPKANAQVKLSLDRMARGGIYDQIGGGFARYSVTSDWLVPHFEKMLYDNAQLLSLYAEAFQQTKNQEYKKVIEQTVTFLARELANGEGGFFSALDADSEGEEGKFYLWDQSAVKKLIPEEDWDFCLAYFDIQEKGNWAEVGRNILQRTTSDETFAKQFGLSLETLQTKVQHWIKALFEAREKRIRPARDEKVLLSWNGLLLKALVDVYLATRDENSLRLAQHLANFLHQKMWTGTHLWHNYKDGKASIRAYLEDYACLIQGLLALYQASFEEKWLQWAEELTQYVRQNFKDEREPLLFFTDEQAEKLIVRKKEIFDNVIPSSNSMMAQNLFTLGSLLAEDSYQRQALELLGQVEERMLQEPRFLSNWGVLYSMLARPVKEVAFVGKNAVTTASAFATRYDPFQVRLGTTTSSQLALLKDKIDTIPDQETTIYVCQNRTCRLPVRSVAEAWQEMQNF